MCCLSQAQGTGTKLPTRQAFLVAQPIPTVASRSPGPQDTSFLEAYMALNVPPQTLSELLAHKGGVKVNTRMVMGMD